MYYIYSIGSAITFACMLCTVLVFQMLFPQENNTVADSSAVEKLIVDTKDDTKALDDLDQLIVTANAAV